ncbi:MAG: zinc ribbon domain-containing protein [Bacillota bacterium]
MDRRAKPRRVATERYILTGKVRCGLCGSAAVDSSTKSGGRIYRYYVCSQRCRNRSCTLKPWPKEQLEQIVVQEVKTRLLTDEGIEQLADRIMTTVREKYSRLLAPARRASGSVEENREQDDQHIERNRGRGHI